MIATQAHVQLLHELKLINSVWHKSQAPPSIITDIHTFVGSSSLNENTVPPLKHPLAIHTDLYGNKDNDGHGLRTLLLDLSKDYTALCSYTTWKRNVHFQKNSNEKFCSKQGHLFHFIYNTRLQSYLVYIVSFFKELTLHVHACHSWVHALFLCDIHEVCSP